MKGSELLWLAHAYERHLALLAGRGHRKGADSTPFAGANEATIMLIADRVLTGLGFLTWPEQRLYEDKSQRADLWAESPTGGDFYVIEGKIIWDGGDNRLNRSRFFEKNELVGDFRRLSELARPAKKVVVWVAFSSSRQVISAGEAAKTLRLGDALAAVKSSFPNASLEGQACVDFEKCCDRPESNFGHVFCWLVGERKE